jgi:hypothetical protein
MIWKLSIELKNGHFVIDIIMPNFFEYFNELFLSIVIFRYIVTL